MSINFEDTIHITPIPDWVTEQEFESEVSRLDGRINVIEASSDVTDVVGTYSDLENYDTSTLTDNDIIKVLVDSTHDDATSYYRWSITSKTFSFVGSLGPFASEDYIDNNFAKQDLSNLSTQGDARLHALKGYEDAGELLTDAEGLTDVTEYAHSTFDLSKFTKVGSPTISEDGIAIMSTSGTQNSKYLKASYNLLDLKDKSWNIKIRFYNSNNATNDRYDILRLGITKQSSICYRKADKRLDFYYSTGTSEEFVSDKGKNFTMPNNFNYVDVSYAYNAQSGEYTFSYVTDNNTNDSYSVTPTTTNKGLYNINTASDSDVITIGQGQSGTQYDSIYPIDLKYFSVIVDGAPVFSGNQTGIDTVKPDDYTIVGSPIISADGVASGFSSSNYITASNLTFNAGDSWEIDVLINTSTQSTQQQIFQFVGDNIEKNSLQAEINTNGAIYWTCPTVPSFTANNRFLQWVSNFSITDYQNKNVYLKFIYNKTQYLFGWSLDGENYTYEAALSSATTSSTQFSGNVYPKIGFRYSQSDGFKGLIDLNGFKIYINDNLVYQPCLKIPYTLSKTGSKIVDSQYRNRVQDVYDAQGYAPYYTLSDTDFTLPMGELYGMIERKMPNTTAIVTISQTDYNNLTVVDPNTLYIITGA